MAEIEGCKHRLEITVPAEEIEKETRRVVESLKEKVKLPGFRPGKVPTGIIRTRYASDIKQDVLEAVIPAHLRAELEKANLDMVGTPNITDVKFEKGEPLQFTAEFDVMPEVELGEYRGLEVEYEEPEVSDEDVDARMEQLREQKAEYINVDPRPVTDGDFAVVSLKSLAGVDGDPIESDEMTLHVGDGETMSDFTDNLRGMEPGQEKEFDVSYPDDYGQQRLAGKTVKFHVTLKVIRKQEIPELDDDFAQDLGDFKDLAELRQALQTNMKGERELIAQQEARASLVDKLVDTHDFPIPETFVERQIESNVEQRMRELMAQGLDPKNIKLDWNKVRETQRDRAVRDVRASMLLNKIGERESVEVTREEVDQQVQRVAKQRQEPAAAIRKELEDADELPRIASRIRTEKTLTFLFEQATKIAKKPEEATEKADE